MVSSHHPKSAIPLVLRATNRIHAIPRLPRLQLTEQPRARAPARARRAQRVERSSERPTLQECPPVRRRRLRQARSATPTTGETAPGRGASFNTFAGGASRHIQEATRRRAHEEVLLLLTLAHRGVAMFHRGVPRLRDLCTLLSRPWRRFCLLRRFRTLGREQLLVVSVMYLPAGSCSTWRSIQISRECLSCRSVFGQREH